MGYLRLDQYVIPIVRFRQYTAVPMQLRHHPGVPLGDSQAHPAPILRHVVLNHSRQALQALARPRRYRHMLAAHQGRQFAYRLGIGNIRLVIYINDRFVACLNLLENLVHRPDVVKRRRVRPIRDQQQQIRLHDLLERGPERGHQRVGEMLDESHGVRHHHLAALRQPVHPRPRVQRGEQLVFHVRLGVRQRVQE